LESRARGHGFLFFRVNYSACLSAFGGKDILFRIDVFLSPPAGGLKKTSIRNIYSLRRSRNNYAE
jgi:hypothetical protein